MDAGKRALGLRVAAALASGAGYAALFPPFDRVVLSWVFAVPLYMALRGASRRAGFALAGLFGFAGTLGIVPWLVPTLTGHFEWSRAEAVALWIGIALAAMAPFTALTLGLSPRLRQPIARVALFAAAWVASEWLRTHVGLASPWTKLGDAHADSPRLRQIADLGGVYAVGFVVAFANAAIAETIARGRTGWGALAPLATAAALVAVSLGYGVARLAPPRASGFEVAIVQGNVESALRWNRASAGRVLHRYASLTRDALGATPAPALVVWPEHAIQTALDDASYGPALRELASHTPILMGAPRSEAERHYNSMQLLRPGGAIDSYDKRRLLPFSETRPLGTLWSFGARGDLDADVYSAGDRAGVFDVAGRRMAALICMEALYPDLAREARALGASWIANPSNDGWYAGSGGAAQHLASVRFRAIETRLPVVRATTTGISAVIAPDGALLTVLGEGASGVLRADLPLPGDPPPYARIGDGFAIACLAVWSAVALFPWGGLASSTRRA
jgi:apolipoprotein N-acyltransferase